MSRQQGYLLILLLLAVTLAGCLTVSGYGDIRGKVVFGSTGEPVQGALVTVGGLGDITDREGYFLIKNVPSGYRNLVVESTDPRNFRGHEEVVYIPLEGILELVGPRAIRLESQTEGRTGGVGGYIYIRKETQYVPSSVNALVFSAQALPSREFEPLRDARVKVAGKSTSSGRDGYFEIYGIAAGSHQLVVEHTALRFPVEERITVRGGGFVRLDNPALYGGVGYYIVIGIDTYPGWGEYNIPGPVEDAQRVYDLLFQNNKLAGLGKKLINSSATKRNIKAAIEEAIVLAEAGERQNYDDYLVIYFSGKSGKDHLIPFDSDGQNWRDEILDSDLETWLAPFPGSVTLIVDGADAASLADGDVFRPYALRQSKYTVLGAARTGEAVNYDPNLGDGGSSVFTHFLLKGISTRSADGNNDGDITARELFDYIESEMYWYYNRNTDSDTHRPSLYEGAYGRSVIFRYRAL